MVVLIEYLGKKILIPGDNESASWKELLDRKDFVDAIRNTDIFIASHHGRESGYYSELFDYFTPKLVVISDGNAKETSVTNKYSNVASGWYVHSRRGYDNKPQLRKCLTTRKDGTIVVKVGKNKENPYINVTIE